MVFVSQSEEETKDFGAKFAAVLETGLTIALNGELGSGKTGFVRAVCRGLEIDEAKVNSPTFVLMQVYADGRLPVAHFDTYRLADVDEFLAIGGEDYLLNRKMVCFVEWAERIMEVFPGDHLNIDIEQLSETGRRLTLKSNGES